MPRSTFVVLEKTGYDWTVRHERVTISRFQNLESALLAANELAASLRMAGFDVEVRSAVARGGPSGD